MMQSTATEISHMDELFDGRNWEPFKLGARKLSNKSHDSLAISASNEGITFRNETTEKAQFRFAIAISAPIDNVAGVKVVTGGKNLSGNGCLWIDKTPMPLNGQSFIPCSNRTKFHLSFVCAAKSEITLSKCELEWTTCSIDLAEECSAAPRVLVVVPDYPSDDNLYMAAFAHSRNRRYQQAGVEVQVAVIKSGKKIQEQYCMDGIPVFVGGPKDLKSLINRKQYRVILVHFAERMHYDIFDGYITDERLIFICHGPETIFPILPNVSRPYFSRPIENPSLDTRKLQAVQKYARKNYVDWVFVSQWLMEKSEEQMDVEFLNKHIIHNVVDESLFPYHEKSDEDRKNILMLRRFDSNRYHSVDIAMEAVLALSRRPVFDDLQFEIIGDGPLFPDLTAPIKNFDNVSLKRTFIPNAEISKIHERNGILLAPSRHDSQGVSSCEAASSGLVVVGSDVTCCGYFFDNNINHTLVDPEDPEALADVIEHLYHNPAEYKATSKRMSDRIHELCSSSETTEREVALIRKRLDEADAHWGELPHVIAEGDPILTVTIPAYNVSGFLAKCLYTLVNHRNAGKMEILVVNDGSTDDTLEVARRFSTASPDIVRIIDKPNGGYGSTINAALKEARGRYFRIIDGDDWVVSENLALLIDFLENEEADLVLTQGRKEMLNIAHNAKIMPYDMLDDGRLYHFDDLTYPLYGFVKDGPLLSTSNYRTELLQNAGFTITEHSPYVDMEYNAFGIRDVKTIRFRDLDIYRYFIGRDGQSVSLEGWRRNYNKHRKIVLGIIDAVFADDAYAASRRDYVIGHIVAPMVGSQLVMYDALGLWDQIPEFLKSLEAHPGVRQKCENYIAKHAKDCLPILRFHEAQLAAGSNALPRLYQAKKAPKKQTSQGKLRKLARGLAPYSLVKRRQDKRRKARDDKESGASDWEID